MVKRRSSQEAIGEEDTKAGSWQGNGVAPF